MKLRHSQADPLPVRKLEPERWDYFYERIQQDPLAYDDYTQFTHEEFVEFLSAPNVLAYEIGDGVGIATLIMDGGNAWVQMVMLDWKFRDDVCWKVIEDGFDAGAWRVTSTVTEDRSRARELVVGLGFEKEAVLRKAFHREGQYLDVEVYGLDREVVWQRQRLQQQR